MKKDVKSSGREKNVTSGGGEVFRRGDGLDINNGKPVGNQDGYQDRVDNQSGRSESRSSNDPNQQGSGSGLFTVLSDLAGAAGSGQKTGKTSSTGSKLKKILIIVAVVVVGYFLLSSFLNKTPASEQNNNTGISAPILSGPGSNSAPLNTTVAGNARAKRTVIKGNGDDSFTIMVYMCGSDLESDYGMATADLNEILNATISDKVNIIVETGGTNSWQNNTISASSNQIYQCTSKGMVLLKDNLGKRSMTDPQTLTDFISYCKTNFPANRDVLILWDHGGGSINGYGYDLNYPNSTMTLDKINTALKNTDCQFDFIGFDACLMATLENAMMLSNYSDYLIASEETEPGTGWYYTNWITAISNNTSLSTAEIGKNIIDDFISVSYQNSPDDKTTLSLIDLAELSSNVPSVFKAFSTSTENLIGSENYKIVSDARYNSREFAQSARIDQVDLINLAQNLKTDDGNKLVDVLKQCVKYNRTSNSITNANGVSIYFPYDKLSGLSTMLSTYEKIGMDEKYISCIKSFANLEAGGKIVTSSSSTPFGSLTGAGSTSANTGTSLISGLLSTFLQSGDFSSIVGSSEGGTSWLDADKLTSSVKYYENHYLNSKDIVLKKSGGDYVLSLSDSDWDIIQNINLNVFVDDGKGYIDLGLDNVFEFDNNGDLKINFDGTWLALNGQVVSYYFMTEDRNGDEYTITGRVPALLNGQLVDIILVFDNKNPYGVVAGARIVYPAELDTVGKGLVEIKDGDKIDFLCDYYTYDQQYNNSYYLGNQLIVNGDLTISNVSIGNMASKVTYRLTDIYDNNYWTPSIDY